MKLGGAAILPKLDSKGVANLPKLNSSNITDNQRQFIEKHRERLNNQDNAFTRAYWWEKRESEPNIKEYKDRERHDGEGNLRIGEPLTFREDMYNLCFVA